MARRRRRKQRERIPLVAIMGWPLVALPPVLMVFVRTGDEAVDPLLRLGFGLPALAALMWAMVRVSDTRRYRRVVVAVLAVAAAEFLGLFLYFFGAIAAGPKLPESRMLPPPATFPSTAPLAPADGPSTGAEDEPAQPDKPHHQ